MPQNLSWMNVLQPNKGWNKCSEAFYNIWCKQHYKYTFLILHATDAGKSNPFSEGIIRLQRIYFQFFYIIAASFQIFSALVVEKECFEAIGP